ncbi:MAG: hypothetical protein ABR591_08730 [Candidatus Velthaea sp.]
MDVSAQSENSTARARLGGNPALQRTLVWVGIAGASAALTFFLVRASMRRAPLDETSERIQSLIDEANRLLKTLDEKKHA